MADVDRTLFISESSATRHIEIIFASGVKRMGFKMATAVRQFQNKGLKYPEGEDAGQDEGSLEGAYG